MNAFDHFTVYIYIFDTEGIRILQIEELAHSHRHDVHGLDIFIKLLDLPDRIISLGCDNTAIIKVILLYQSHNTLLQICICLCGLQLDIHIRSAIYKFNRLSESRNLLSRKIFSVIRIQIILQEFLISKIADFFICPRNSLYIFIMHDHDHAVFSLSHVKFNNIGTVLNGNFKRRQRILRSFLGSPSMCGNGNGIDVIRIQHDHICLDQHVKRHIHRNSQKYHGNNDIDASLKLQRRIYIHIIFNLLLS